MLPRVIIFDYYSYSFGLDLPFALLMRCVFKSLLFGQRVYENKKHVYKQMNTRISAF
jgi:hypothetical protein